MSYRYSVGPIALRRVSPTFHVVINTTLGIRTRPGKRNGDGSEYDIVSLLDTDLVVVGGLESQTEAKSKVRKMIFDAIDRAIDEEIDR